MNFIDEALLKITNGEDFVQAMAEIYEHPEIRKILMNYPTWIRNIITIIDYDTELTMDGLEQKSYKDVIETLLEIGLSNEAHVLISLENDFSQENMDICYSNLALNNDYETFWNKIYLYADGHIHRLS